MRREAKDCKREKLEFRGETVKVFFFVLVDMCKKGVVGGGDAFDSKEIVDGEIAAGLSWAISHDSMVKNMKLFDGGGERGVYKRVKIRVQGLKDGDRTFIGGARFINKGATGGFKGFGKDSSGEDERNQALELLEPCGMET